MSALDDANDSDSSDGVPEIGLDALRPEALAALLSVKQARETAAADATALPDDFGMSQFWYTDACADALAAAVRDRGRVAVVSCPTAHRALCRAGDAASVLFEFDARCGANLGDRFCRYDFNEDFQAKIPSHFEGAFDVVILDPPYVSRDCLEAFWSFAAWLSRGAAVKLVLTSVVNRPWLLDWGLALTDFELRFTSKLCTPLRAFTDSDDVAVKLGGFAPPAEDS